MLKIIVGCYEQMLLGYAITKCEDEGQSSELQAELIFTDHSHSGCIKTVACGASYLASGATDETIFLFDVINNKEIGSLQGHEGTVNHLCFPDDRYMTSTSDDGAINVWKVSSKWEKAKCLRGHKGPVKSFAVHPSGKLAFSASPKDGTLRTWNMISGRPVYVKNMKKFCPEIVKFSPKDGEYYLISSSKRVQIYGLESAECVAEIEWKSTILSVEFISKELFAVAGEGGEIFIYKTENGKNVVKIEAHTSRIKALHRIVPPKFSTDEDERPQIWLASASSDGHVKIWCIDEAELMDSSTSVLKAPKCILDFETKARVTCLTSWESKTD